MGRRLWCHVCSFLYSSWECSFSPFFPSIGIVISSSASPTEGTSSDSCLTSSSNDSSVALSSCLAGQVMTGSPATARMTSSFLASQSDAPVLQAQGCMGGASLLPVSFQEGRRASDTSLTQGNVFLLYCWRIALFQLPLEKGSTQGYLLACIGVRPRPATWQFCLLYSWLPRESWVP